MIPVFITTYEEACMTIFICGTASAVIKMAMTECHSQTCLKKLKLPQFTSLAASNLLETLSLNLLYLHFMIYLMFH
jgi:hypothetical protein